MSANVCCDRPGIMQGVPSPAAPLPGSYRHAHRCASGFTYIGVLVGVGIMGIGLAALGTVWQTAAQREKERQLLFVGSEFRRAIQSYFEGSPGDRRFPEKFDELLLDRRFPAVRRHLRRIYHDPMTGSADWGLVLGPGNRIMGVFSRSTGRPLKSAGFGSGQEDFMGATTYADWRFVYIASESGAVRAGAAGGGTDAPSSGAPDARFAGSPQAAPPAAR